MSDIAFLKKFVNSEIGTPSMKPLDKKIEDLGIDIDKKITLGDCDFYKIKVIGHKFNPYDKEIITVNIGKLNPEFSGMEITPIFLGTAKANYPGIRNFVERNNAVYLEYIPQKDIVRFVDVEYDGINLSLKITIERESTADVELDVCGVVIVVPKSNKMTGGEII